MPPVSPHLPSTLSSQHRISLFTTKTNPPLSALPTQIKSILFDCDNTLVLSEALAFEACAELSNELLKKYSIDKQFTGHELLQTFVGQNFRGMMVGLQEKYNFTMPEDELNDYVERELGAVIAKLDAAAEPCEGVMEQLEEIKKTYSGDKEMVVVSSSAKSRVLASMKKAGVMPYFKEEYVYSAVSSRFTSSPDLKLDRARMTRRDGLFWHDVS